MAERTGLLSPANRRLSIAIYTSIALIAFEGSSVAAALPDLAADLGGVRLLPWVVSGFLFAAGLTTIIAGPIVDAVGSRALFGWSTFVFAGSGFVAGLVNDLPTMLVIRLIQGGASGFLFAATLAAVNVGFPESLTGRAFAANATIWGVVGAAAPGLAAALLNVASWRWIFFINLPLGLLAYGAGHRRMPVRQPGAESLSIDWRGGLLAAVFTLSSLLAVDSLDRNSLVFASIAGASVVGYVRHARRSPRPVLSSEHIAVQPYAGLAIVPSLMVAAAFTTNVYVTVYVAAGRGLSNGDAAWSVLFFTVGWTIGANASSRLLEAHRPPWVMGAGLAWSIVGLSVVPIGSGFDLSLAVVFAGLLALGIGVGLATNASVTMLRAVTPAHRVGRASAANQFARSQGYSLGAATGGAVLLFVVDRRLGSVEPVRRLLSGDDLTAGAEIAESVRAGFTGTAIVSLVIAVLAIWPMWRLARAAADAQRTPAPVG